MKKSQSIINIEYQLSDINNTLNEEIRRHKKARRNDVLFTTLGLAFLLLFVGYAIYSKENTEGESCDAINVHPVVILT